MFFILLADLKKKRDLLYKINIRLTKIKDILFLTLTLLSGNDLTEKLSPC